MTDSTRIPTWHDHVFFGLHFDLHPSATDTSLGADTTYAHIRAELEKVKPDFVQYDCKGHPGYTGYPTKIGVTSPGVVKDALKIWRRVTRDMGIPLSVHYSGVWDGVQWERHPEWARLRSDGRRFGEPDGPEMAPGFAPQPMAADSLYDDVLLIPQLKEVIDLHDIDGVWVDGECWAAAPDWSARTRQLFTEATGIADIPVRPEDAHWHDYMRFNRERFVAHLRRYAGALHNYKAGFAVCSNWAYTVRMPDDVDAPLDYLSGDFTWAFGLQSAELEAKFMDSRGLPWDLMAWGFTTAGAMRDAQWTAKTAPHLQMEGVTVAANGGAFWIYDQPTRSGRLVGWHMDTFAEVAKFMRVRQHVCQNTTSEPHVALLHSQSHFYANNHPENTSSVYHTGTPAVTLTGALQLLLDNGFHADVVNESTLLRNMSRYPVIAIMEQTHLPEALREAVLDWVKQGGKLLLTGAHVTQDWGKATGVKLAGDPIEGAAYVPATHPGAGEGIQGSVPMFGRWQPVRCTRATILSPLLKTPELRSALRAPAATLSAYGKGAIAVVHGPLATAYGGYQYPGTRVFAGEVLRALAPEMPVEIDAPAFVHLTVRRTKDGARIIHLVNTASENPLSPVQPLIESVAETGPITVHVQQPRRPKSVTLEPGGRKANATWRAGKLAVKIDALHIHNAIVVND